MSLNINQFSQEWATVLSSYSNDSGGSVQLKISTPSLELPKATLSESEMTDISRQIVRKKEELDSDILRKVSKSFETFKSHLENRNRTEFPNLLNSFAARFSRWANQHSLLARILSHVTFGFFNKLWNEGNRIYQNKQNLEERIKAFEGFSREIEQTILSSQVAASKTEVQLTQENQKLTPEVVGEILDFLDTEERKKISAWDFAKKAMEKSRGFQDQMMDEMVEVFKCLDVIPKDKLEQIKELKKFFKNEFPIPSYFSRESTRICILNYIFVILGVVKHPIPDNSHKTLQTLFNVQELRKWLFLFYKRQTFELSEDVGITITKRDFLEGCNLNWLYYAPLEIKNDKEVVLALVSKDGSLLQHASEQLKNDKEVVLAAVSQNEHAFELASYALQNDSDIMLAAFNRSEFCSIREFNNFVLARVLKEGKNLQSATDTMKKDDTVK